MKIRNGFVSNSSSSSFLIYGICVDPHEVFDSKKWVDYCKENGIVTWNKQEYTEEDFEDECSENINIVTPLECIYGPSYCDNDIYIGKSWDSIKDDQTGKEFKDDIQKEVNELYKAIGKDGVKIPSCGSHEEAWRDG